jgi:hypothetical protein
MRVEVVRTFRGNSKYSEISLAKYSIQVDVREELAETTFACGLLDLFVAPALKFQFGTRNASGRAEARGHFTWPTNLL